MVKYQLRNKNYNTEVPDLALYDLLADRGIVHPDKWLNPSEEYELSPFLLRDMKKATSILRSTINNPDSKILVVVDSDLDGYTSGAIIISLLNIISKGQEIDYVLHPGKEHGIELKDIPEDVNLVIVPDAGSSQKEEHMKLLQSGKKIIILDHHEISNDFLYKNYEDNIAIVNSQIGYDNPALSGAGVALKFVQAYCYEYKVTFPNKLYALAGCGIVADVMDISSLENKYIITKGLKYISEHPFLMALIQKAHFNQKNPTPSIKDIGWVIGPNINSIIRLGTMSQKHIIFSALVSPLSMVYSSKRGCEDEEVPVFDEAVRLCDNAKKRQTTAINKSIKIIEDNEAKGHHNALIYVDEEQELTFELSGLIANKLLSQNNKPVILLRRYTDNKGTDEYRGSVRGKAAEGLDNLKDTIKDLSGVRMAEGHAFAFGIGIDRDSLPIFKEHLEEVLSTVDFNTNLYLVDFVSAYTGVNKEIAKIMGADDIWSHGVEKPLGVINKIPTQKYELMGATGQHIKIDCGGYDVVLFNVPQLVEKLEKGEKYNLEVVGEFDVDKSYNIGRLQFIAKDYELQPYEAPTIWEYAF